MPSIDSSSKEGRRESNTTSEHAGQIALETGLMSGLKALAVSSTSVFLAQKYWPSFRYGLNVSGKTAIVVSCCSCRCSLNRVCEREREREKEKERERKRKRERERERERFFDIFG